jgi:hypothetical protein
MFWMLRLIAYFSKQLNTRYILILGVDPYGINGWNELQNLEQWTIQNLSNHSFNLGETSRIFFHDTMNNITVLKFSQVEITARF